LTKNRSYGTVGLFQEIILTHHAPKARNTKIMKNNLVSNQYRAGQIALMLTIAGSLMARADYTQEELNKHVGAAAAIYSSLQTKPDTAFPQSVTSNAKGVLIISRWSGAVGIGGTGGWAVGMEKQGGKYSAPAFYSIGGGSIGLQLGGGKTETVAFLMSDKALQTLTDSKFVWSGNVRAVAGPKSTSDSTVDNTADVILYQQASGLDAGATVAATSLSVDNASNRTFYSNVTITPEDIFSGKATVPEASKPLCAVVNTSK
jgi:SH3 domain-containing YSC84-like protein 1